MNLFRDYSFIGILLICLGVIFWFGDFLKPAFLMLMIAGFLMICYDLFCDKTKEKLNRKDAISRGNK